MSAISRRVPLEKRKRTEISCDTCKLRKQKCHRNAKIGKCRYCEEHHIECVSTQIRKQRIYGTVEGLGLRLSILESLVKGLFPEADLATTDGMQHLALELGIPLSSQNTPAEAKSVQADERLLQDTQGHVQYIGPRSSYFLMTKLRTIFGHRDSREEKELCQTLGKRTSTTVSSHGSMAPQMTRGSNYKIPAEAIPDLDNSVANILVDAFFEIIHPDYPVLHEGSFRETFECWLASPGAVDGTWLCSFLGVLILARRVVHINIPEEQELKWWAQVQGLLPSILSVSSVPAIQALMLCALHLHNTNNRDACWTFTGSAIRIGFAIGLHRDGVGMSLTPLMRELRKRLWWTLYSFEQMQVSSHDRPSAIELVDCSVGCPKESILDLGGKYPSGYMLWSNRLASILGQACRVLKTTRTTSPGDAYDGPLSPGAGLLRELNRWNSALPSHLSLQAIETNPPACKRSLLLLHLQYYYTLGLISRSALLARVVMLSGNRITTLPEGTLSAADQCITSGRMSCQLVQMLDALGTNNATVWWDMFYNYSSVLILTLNTMFDAMSGNTNAAAESRRLLGDCAMLARSQLQNSLLPATFRRWATVVTDLDSMADDFVHGFREQHKIGTTVPEQSHFNTIRPEPVNPISLEAQPLKPISYAREPIETPTLPPFQKGASEPLSSWSADDPDAVPAWDEFQWEDLGSILFGGEDSGSWYYSNDSSM